MKEAKSVVVRLEGRAFVFWGSRWMISGGLCAFIEAGARV